MGAIYQLLKGEQSRFGNATPQGDPSEQERVWQEWWETLELIRVLVEEPLAWSSHFMTGLVGLLSLRERLAIPGVMESLLWTGGDSTLETIGAVDWDGKVYGVS